MEIQPTIKKFARVDGQALHLHSVAGLTHTNFNIPMHYFYDELLRLTRYLTGSQQAVNEQFKRMILTQLVEIKMIMLKILLSAKKHSIKEKMVKEYIEHVSETFARFKKKAMELNVKQQTVERIYKELRLHLIQNLSPLVGGIELQNYLDW